MENNLFIPYYEQLLKEGKTEEIKVLKLNTLGLLKGHLDLVYGDCMRDDRSVIDVFKAIETIKEAFNIQSCRQGQIKDYSIDSHDSREN